MMTLKGLERAGIVWLMIIGGTICAAAEEQAAKIDLSRDGTYRAGKWTYVYRITRAGTRSQGSEGTLSYDGQPRPRPFHASDYYETPLGRFYHTGGEGPLWDAKGWMPFAADSAKPERAPLPLPGSEADLLLQARSQMKRILDEQTALGAKSPFLLEEREDRGQTHGHTDPWGSPYHIYPDCRSSEGGGMVARLIIQSSGPDRNKDSADDLRMHGRFISLHSEGDRAPVKQEKERVLPDSRP